MLPRRSSTVLVARRLIRDAGVNDKAARMLIASRAAV